MHEEAHFKWNLHKILNILLDYIFIVPSLEYFINNRETSIV